MESFEFGRLAAAKRSWNEGGSGPDGSRLLVGRVESRRGLGAAEPLLKSFDGHPAGQNPDLALCNPQVLDAVRGLDLLLSLIEFLNLEDSSYRGERPHLAVPGRLFRHGSHGLRRAHRHLPATTQVCFHLRSRYQSGIQVVLRLLHVRHLDRKELRLYAFL